MTVAGPDPESVPPADCFQVGALDLRRVVATPAALALIAELRDRHGAILFRLAGADRRPALACHPASGGALRDGDVCLGEEGGVPVYLGRALLEFWRPLQMIIDLVSIRSSQPADSGSDRQRLIVRARRYTDAELAALGAWETWPAAPAPLPRAAPMRRAGR